jgi:aminoglycoside phosphotransferase (APT) family kinase protein
VNAPLVPHEPRPPQRPLAVGRTAEVYAVSADEVVKILQPGFDDDEAELEAEIAARLNTLGVPAPRFLGLTQQNDRPALRYERINGPSMLQALTARPWRALSLARDFAVLHGQIHDRSGSGLQEARSSMAQRIEAAAEALGKARHDAVLERLQGLPAGDVLLHGDLHPANVLMRDRGPMAIDWIAARFGPAEADVARTLFLVRESHVPDELPLRTRTIIALVRGMFARTYLHAYAERRPLDLELVRAWRLPTLAARLHEDIQAERVGLLREIDRELFLGRGSGNRRGLAGG